MVRCLARSKLLRQTLQSFEQNFTTWNALANKRIPHYIAWLAFMEKVMMTPSTFQNTEAKTLPRTGQPQSSFKEDTMMLPPDIYSHSVALDQSVRMMNPLLVLVDI